MESEGRKRKLPEQPNKKFKHSLTRRKKMAKVKRVQRSRPRLSKLIHKTIDLMHQQRSAVQTWIIAYQFAGSPIYVTASPNMYRFVRTSDGIEQVFSDAMCAQDASSQAQYQSPTDAMMLLSREEMRELAKELGHNRRCSGFRRQFATESVSEDEAEEDNAQEQTTTSGAHDEEDFATRFQKLSLKQKHTILTTTVSRLNKFQAHAAIMLNLEICDPGVHFISTCRTHHELGFIPYHSQFRTMSCAPTLHAFSFLYNIFTYCISFGRSLQEKRGERGMGEFLFAKPACELVLFAA